MSQDRRIPGSVVSFSRQACGLFALIATCNCSKYNRTHRNYILVDMDETMLNKYYIERHFCKKSSFLAVGDHACQPISFTNFLPVCMFTTAFSDQLLKWLEVNEICGSWRRSIFFETCGQSLQKHTQKEMCQIASLEEFQ